VSEETDLMVDGLNMCGGGMVCGMDLGWMEGSLAVMKCWQEEMNAEWGYH